MDPVLSSTRATSSRRVGVFHRREGRQLHLGGSVHFGAVQREAGVGEGRAVDQLQVGGQRLVADRVDVGGRVGVGAGGVERRGVERVLQFPALFSGLVDVEDAQRHRREHRERDREGDRADAALVAAGATDEVRQAKLA
jgi:hypothetical protein